MSVSTNNKYLIFVLETERYGIPIAKVQEVISYVPITSLHETSESFLKGVINLRGRIIPIIDMRLKFALPEKDYTERTIFIIVEIVTTKDLYHVGLVVDAVQDVVEISEDKIEKTPEVGFKLKNRYLQGLIQLQDTMVMILNLDNILATDEVVELAEKIEINV
ncbi:MAG TPA: chemotaxis protein CheW [Spirochaetota bacterium]|jgi:purine-binding chemotaxis protein CheW|nr:chemotaxis protein CheW [Spirochaetota bacterium]HRU66527.1 chemotaxis protein CheW [Spirochaetota bacterium]